MKYKFYDTCSLLLKVNHLWEEDSILAISSVTLEELEHIKTAANKDPDVKFAARRVVQELDNHYREYKVITWQPSLANLITDKDLFINEDSKIIISALYMS